MTLANCRLVIFLPPLYLLSIMFFQSISLDLFEKKKVLKRMGERRHSCVNPTVVLNHFPMLLFIGTALVALS